MTLENTIGKFSMTNVFRIYNDSTGDHLEIGEDRDGLDLVEIRHYSGKEVIQSIVMEVDQAALVHRALGSYLSERG